MKAVAVSILMFAIIAAAGTAIARSIHTQRVLAETPCVGLGCWPDTPPVKHRPGYAVTLQPVW